MSINANFDNYRFQVRSEHFAPLLAEPIVQLAVQFIGYLGIAYTTTLELIKELKLVDFAALLVKLLGIYCSTLAYV